VEEEGEEGLRVVVYAGIVGFHFRKEGEAESHGLPLGMERKSLAILSFSIKCQKESSMSEKLYYSPVERAVGGLAAAEEANEKKGPVITPLLTEKG